MIREKKWNGNVAHLYSDESKAVALFAGALKKYNFKLRECKTICVHISKQHQNNSSNSNADQVNSSYSSIHIYNIHILKCSIIWLCFFLFDWLAIDDLHSHEMCNLLFPFFFWSSIFKYTWTSKHVHLTFGLKM